jgi:hypothetical protein
MPREQEKELRKTLESGRAGWYRGRRVRPSTGPTGFQVAGIDGRWTSPQDLTDDFDSGLLDE